MDILPVGQLIGSNAKRDAIHIAIAPVIATEELSAGEPIWFVPGSTEKVESAMGEPLGIVDPWLKRRVLPGQRFYMWMTPNTITSLRHHWTHPAFGEQDLNQDCSHAEATKIVTELANRIGIEYDVFISAALDYVKTGNYHSMGSNENYKDLTTYDWVEFWTCFRQITGMDHKDDYGFFCCAC